MFCNLVLGERKRKIKNQPWQFFFFSEKSALCMRTTWYTSSMCSECKCLHKRRHTDPWERSLPGIHISRHLWLETVPNSFHWSQHMTYTKWDCLSGRTVKAIIPNKSTLLFQILSCSVPQNRYSCPWLSHQIFSFIHHKWLNAGSHYFDSLLMHSYHLLTAFNTDTIVFTTPLSSATPQSYVQPNAPIVIPMVYWRCLWTVSCCDVNGWKWQWGHRWLAWLESIPGL